MILCRNPTHKHSRIPEKIEKFNQWLICRNFRLGCFLNLRQHGMAIPFAPSVNESFAREIIQYWEEYYELWQERKIKKRLITYENIFKTPVRDVIFTWEVLCEYMYTTSEPRYLEYILSQCHNIVIRPPALAKIEYPDDDELPPLNKYVRG